MNKLCHRLLLSGLYPTATNKTTHVIAQQFKICKHKNMFNYLSFLYRCKTKPKMSYKLCKCKQQWMVLLLTTILSR